MVKSEFPDSIVILGGYHPTALPEEALAIPEVDFVIRGEGEEIAGMFLFLPSYQVSINI